MKWLTSAQTLPLQIVDKWSLNDWILVYTVRDLSWYTWEDQQTTFFLAFTIHFGKINYHGGCCCCLQNSTITTSLNFLFFQKLEPIFSSLACSFNLEKGVSVIRSSLSSTTHIKNTYVLNLPLLCLFFPSQKYPKFYKASEIALKKDSAYSAT